MRRGVMQTRYFSWTIVEEVKIPKQTQRHFRCRCVCGFIKIIQKQSLISGTSKRCFNCAFKTHGMSKTNIYQIWGGIISRCYNPKVKIYKYYGGRGIKVSESWNKFENFYRDMGNRPIGMQVDRIDNDGDYCVENCQWVTPKENNPYLKGTVADDMPGKRFGKWSVIEGVKHKPGHRYYKCRCECGTTRIIPGGDLRARRTTQCKSCAQKAHSAIHKGWSERKKNANKPG